MSYEKSGSTLNQWQKIWLILTVLWVIIVAALSIVQQAPIYSAAGLTTLILLMVLPCILVYVLGLFVHHLMVQNAPPPKKTSAHQARSAD